MFAQQVLKDQNCNFSSFENSGEDLINEVSISISDLENSIMPFFQTITELTCIQCSVKKKE